MPVVLRIGSLRFMFYSNEGDPREPVHIHIRKGRDEAKFWLGDSVSLAYNAGFDAKTLNSVQRLVEDHKDELERAWYDYFS